MGETTPRTAHEYVSESPASLIERAVDAVLSRALAKADARHVYGEPVTQGQRTIIPVAKVRYVFGVGAGRGTGDAGEGSGGGAGGAVLVRPVGYLEVTPEATRFRPIVDVSRLAVVATVFAGIALLMLLRRAVASRDGHGAANPVPPRRMRARAVACLAAVAALLGAFGVLETLRRSRAVAGPANAGLRRTTA